jgi:hypothetical protein
VRVVSLALILAAILTAASPPLVASAQIDSVVVHADRVAFYDKKYVVTADNNVRVTLTDGTTITGRTFAMDLKLNRFIVAGGVHVVHGSSSYDGAAFSDFLDYKRAYFLPITTEPDRWTFMDEDYAKPVPGRIMPGDAFALADTGVDHPFVLAKEARIIPKTGVDLSPARIYTLGAYAPAPDYYQNFSSNPYFAQNSLTGATGAVGLPILGSAHATTTIYGRYDTANKAYLAIEQHLVGNNDYAVFSISPLTRPLKQYNFLGLIKTSNQRFQLTNFDQMTAFQSGFSQPESETGFQNVQLTYALKNSFLQLNANQYEQSLLPQPAAGYYVNPNSGAWIPNHPNNWQLAWVGADRAVTKYTPINFKLRGGILEAHDNFGLGSFGGTPYTSYWEHFLGFTLWSNPQRLTKRAPFDQSAYISMIYDRQRTFVSSFPRFQDASTLTTTVNKLNGRRGSMYLSYIISNQGDYLGPNQSLIYPSTVLDNPFNGQIYPGWAAFDGFATIRDLQFAYNFTPTPYFSFTLQADKHKDFPAPIPYWYGAPPYSISLRTQIRLSTVLSLQIARSYGFNFGNQGWSGWTIQFGP